MNLFFKGESHHEEVNDDGDWEDKDWGDASRNTDEDKEVE